MEKEEITRIAEKLHQEALIAASYFSIIQQYEKLHKEYHKEMSVSPAFYSMVDRALQESCFMAVARLYDQSSGVITIGKLIQLCKENCDYFSPYAYTIEDIDNGISFKHNIPYQHKLKEREKCFYREEIEHQKEWNTMINDIWGIESDDTEIELTFSEYLNLHYKCAVSMSKKIEAVRIQRGQIYAHNDKDGLLTPSKIQDKNPITYDDMHELIDLAQDVTSLVLSSLTGKCPANKYSNIDDLETTLMAVRNALKNINQ